MGLKPYAACTTVMPKHTKKRFSENKEHDGDRNLDLGLHKTTF